MKTPFCRRRIDGFTLVELLVVIAIIAVLAAAGFTAGNAAIQRAKRMTALSSIQGLNQAVGDFFTEYGAFPVKTPPAEDNAASPILTDATGVDVLEELLGYKDANDADTINTKNVKFLNVKQSKDSSTASKPKDGLVFNESSGSGMPSVKGLYDPWGGAYSMVFDFNLDDKLEVKPKAASSSTTLYSRKFAAWTDGVDSKKSTDDVYSWK